MSHRILIIEDDEDVYDFLDPLLREKGYDVRVSNDGEDGLRQIDEFRPDLVVLDLMMPSLDGFGVLEALSGRPAPDKPQVIVLSAVDRMGGVEEALHRGAFAYLSKPIETDRLLQKIKEALAS
jgi:two-component system, OmpR family, response regulator